MFLRQLDLTTALRPSLYDGESLLFVAERVGLYEGRFKIEKYQNGSAYLTSHRICYVDNEDPRTYSVAVDLKEIERTEFYAGFLKSSPKVTLFPKPGKRYSQAIRSPAPQYPSSTNASTGISNGPSRPLNQSPAPTRDINATWICPICGLPNTIPASFDPSTANQYTPLPPCQACGIKPSLVHMVKAAIAAISNRTPGTSSSPQPARTIPTGLNNELSSELPPISLNATASNQCPRCTFNNHPSLMNCEVCGASLTSVGNTPLQRPENGIQRPESPGPTMNGSIIGDDTIETIKFSFRAGGGGEKIFLERLREALVQRKWLLQSAPPVPKPITPSNSGTSPWQTPDLVPRTSTPQRVVGIAGLEQREAELRESNKTVISTAFEDLEGLMTSAKEVIAMAEQFARQMDQGSNPESASAKALISDSAAALGLVTTKDMLGSGSASETLYITELARNLAEFLTDDRRGVLRKEGGIMSLVDLWAVFNRTRNGIELISPLDFEKAANMWESLHLPIRLRRFKSGLLVVQEKNRTDDKTIASLLSWLRDSSDPSEGSQPALTFGKGVTAQETAERFGWSVGVANEELEMAEEMGAVCRDQCLDGTRFWENHFAQAAGAPASSYAGMSQMLNELSV